MGKYIIEGGRKLCGAVGISGSKNAALPVLCACVINGGKNIIHNCPEITDVEYMCDILRETGCDVRREGKTVTVDSSSVYNGNITLAEVKKIRSSVTLIGPLAGRLGSMSVSRPGGCTIGDRPIDIHIEMLKKLGAEINENEDEINVKAGKLKGAVLKLPFASVGATENAIMAAVFAEGTTAVINAAREPEVVCLQNFLIQMGIEISGAETGTIIVEGCKKFRDTEFDIIYDRIEAGTFLCSVCGCGGEIFLQNAPWQQMISITQKISEAGCRLSFCDGGIYAKADEKIKNIEILKTGIYPAFPTDMQSQFMSMLTLAQGTSIIIETMFENRFKAQEELCKMSADIVKSKNVCIIKGVKTLKCAEVNCHDLRTGAALINAALCAEGESVVCDSQFVERGYENIEEKLKKLGAKIELKIY